MRNPVELKVVGLKCDAPGCDYVDPNAVADECYVNTPCPKCGANLLTQSDWNFVKMLSSVSDWANDAIGPVPDDSKYELLRIEMDGSGMPSNVCIEEKQA